MMPRYSEYSRAQPTQAEILAQTARKFWAPGPGADSSN